MPAAANALSLRSLEWTVAEDSQDSQDSQDRQDSEHSPGSVSGVPGGGNHHHHHGETDSSSAGLAFRILDENGTPVEVGRCAEERACWASGCFCFWCFFWGGGDPQNRAGTGCWTGCWMWGGMLDVGDDGWVNVTVSHSPEASCWFLICGVGIGGRDVHGGDVHGRDVHGAPCVS